MTMRSNYLHTQTSNSLPNHSKHSEVPRGTSGVTRLAKITHLLDVSGANFLFSDHLEFIHYLTGFRGSNGTLLVRRHPEPAIYLCTDGRYLEQAAFQAKTHGADLLIDSQPLLGPDGVLITLGIPSSVAVDLQSLRLTNYLSLQRSGYELADVSASLATMRAKKEPSEIAAISEAAEIADRAIVKTLSHLANAPTELELAGWFEYYVRECGGEGVSFPTIVASGPRTSLPHAQPTRQRIEAPTPVVIDFGAMVDGYCSDSTRSFYLGTPPDRYRRAYEIVTAAKAAGVAQLRTGNRVNAVEVATRGYLREQGVEEHLLHGVGHGVGLEIHEFPFTSTAVDVAVEPTMCITVEPGLYYAEDFGIRLEDLYLTTESAPISLSHSSELGVTFD
ncbi:aminopeptidase P family protein [Ferrimicrobium sp.]|uniref:aminopeptidase P family protein n=1 Tax=Ferrimicrobium sp. TaxID=2926050 RepID=UPI002612ACD0|nr:aminopeptidase P family protein [Ferrimicrobium sp.]